MTGLPASRCPSIAPLAAVFALLTASACVVEPDEGGGDDAAEDTAGEDEESTGEEGTEAEGGTNTEVGTDTTEGTETGETLATISGVVTDMEGAPLPSPVLQFCGPIDESGLPQSCLPIDVEADGSWIIEAQTLGLWSLKFIHVPADGRDFTGQAFQIELGEGDALSYAEPPVVVPEVAGLVDLSGASGEVDVELEGGLRLNFDPENTITPLFTPAEAVGALVVDPSHWQLGLPPAGDVAVAWSFTPFGTKVKEGAFGLSIDDTLGLDPGTAVSVYEIEKDNGAYHLVATGTVGDTAVELTQAGEGLHELSWIYVVVD